MAGAGVEPGGAAGSEAPVGVPGMPAGVPGMPAGVPGTPAGMPEARRELFELRVARWRPDLLAGLAGVWPAGVAGPLADRLVAAAAAAYAVRDPELHRLDQARTLAPDWFQQPTMIGYAAYTERLAGDLRGVRGALDHLAGLGVTYLHLMPVLLPREGDSDGGYAVADYRRVRPDLGDVADLRGLAREMHGRGMSLVLDLVLNHVAREHEWAVRARAGEHRFREFFRVYPDRGGPDAWEATLPEVFPDFAPGNFTWDDELSGWVWTTFNSFQWDVDWSNPEVLVAYAEIVLELANLGVDVLRLDAVAFIWKRLGTTCQNQPEVHALTQVLRALTRIACPGVLLKAEAIVAPEDLAHYLGRGPHVGRVSDLAYHNTLMVQVWSMLAAQDARLAARALSSLPAVPTTTAWITYARCHDDIGWAVSDADAAAVGLSGFDHRSFLSDWYSGAFEGSRARGLVFQENPETRDRRISGTAAALTGLAAATGVRGVGRPELDGPDPEGPELHDPELQDPELQDPELHGPDVGVSSPAPALTPAVAAVDPAGVDDAVGRLLLAYAVVFGWGGIPVLWSGDELGSPGDPDWAADPAHAADNRWVNRPFLDAAALATAQDPATVPGRVLAGVRHLARVRAGLPHLHASVASEVLELSDPGVLPVLRRHPLGNLLELYNATDQWRPWPWWRLEGLELLDACDVLSDAPADRVAPAGDGNLWLPPWAAAWLIAR